MLHLMSDMESGELQYDGRKDSKTHYPNFLVTLSEHNKQHYENLLFV